jgi:crossover junction endodeoxyribonuclease RuvC
VRIVGIDPGSERTGYGCVETDGRRHRLVTCGAITAAAGDPFPNRLSRIYNELTSVLAKTRPDCVAVESVFHAINARSALKLGHARGVAILAAVEAGCGVVEYTPAEVKRAVVGYGRADKRQIQQMIKLLLGLDKPPSPYDAADALAVAICHLHSQAGLSQAGLKARLYGKTASTPEGQTASTPEKTASTPDVEADLQVRLPKTRLRSWRQYRPAHG